MEAAAHPWPTLGVLILRDGLVPKEQLEAILEEQRDSRQQRMSGHRLGEILIDRGLITPTDVAKLVAEQYELPFSQLDTSEIELRVAHRISEELARRLSAIPISVRPSGTYVLAIADPATVLFSDELRRVLGSALQFVVVGPDAMEAAISYVFDRTTWEDDVPDAPDPGYFGGAILDLHQDGPTSAEASYETAPPTAHVSRTTHHNPPLGALLVREGLVSEDELDAALAQQRLSTSWRLGEILVNRGAVTPAGVARVIAEQYELPFVDLENAYVDPAVVVRLPREVARNFPAVPIAEGSDGSLQVAIADPTNVYYSDELQEALGVALTFVVAAPAAIEAVIESVHAPEPEPEHEHDETLAEVHAADAPAVPFAVEEVVAETGHHVAEFAHDLTTGGDVVATAEEELAQDDHAVVVDEAVGQEGQPGEPILGWLPTWTTELRLVDDEPEVASTEEEDLTAALLAEAARTDGPRGADEIEVTVEADEPVTHWEQEDEVPTEPASVLALVDSGVVEHEEPALGPDYFEALSDALEEPVADETLPDALDAPVVLEALPDTAEEPVVLELLPDALEDSVELAAATPAPARDDIDIAVEEVLALGASAVHFSPNDGEYVVRARVDGRMRELGVLPLEDVHSIVEGFQRAVEVRINVVGTAKGDKITLFPLEPTAAPATLAELGLAHDAEASVRDALARPWGVFVVCGPGGSGTTTTLHTTLEVLNTPDRVVATVEDPIARVLDGVDQVQVDRAAGVTFADGLRTLLANDSDVVLVGEIDDSDTAEVAFASVPAGRHVLAALHARSAAAGLRRLLDLGLEPSRIGDALACVVAQRLVRRICLDCRETYYATDSELADLAQPSEDAGPRLLARGRGCDSCGGTGFRGRVGIFEVLRVSDEIRSLLARDASTEELHEAAVAGGMRPLQEDGIRLCLEGLTTSAELRQVLGEAS